MSRQLRQAKIIELVNQNEIETQQELALELKKAGFSVTQATVSRDIQELGLTKNTGVGARTHYVKPLDPKLSKLKNVFHQSVVSIESTANLIVIKTMTATANSACALIDQLDIKDIMGSVAGDDTILIVVRTPEAVENVVRQFRQLIS